MRYLDANSPKIEQPKCIKKKLFEHQMSSVYAMAELERTNSFMISVQNNNANVRNLYRPDAANSSFWPNETPVDILINTNMGIYSDKVGAGKTLSMLSLIAYNNNLKKKDKAFIRSTESSYYYSPFGTTANIILHDKYKFVDTNLILVSHSLINQWKKHLELFENLDFVVINKKAHMELIVKEKDYCLPKVKVILLSINMFKKYNCFDKQIVFNRLIIDEPQSIAFSNSLPNSKFLWLICATPRDILYPSRVYLKEIIAPLTYRNMNLMTHLIIKNKDEFVDLSLQLPSYIEKSFKCKAPHLYRQLRDNLTKEALTALRANDISGAIATLSCNADSQDNILDALVQNLKDNAHNEELEINRLMNLRNINDNERQNRISVHKEKLESLNTRINSIIERVSNSKNICPICLDEVTMPVAITGCCQNSYCFECILMSMNMSSNKMCPMCKTPNCDKTLHINTDDTNYAEKNEKTDENDENKLKSKAETLMNILSNMNEDSRFLVFSEYSATFHEISYKLKTKNIKYSQLIGTLNQQEKVLEKFRKGEIKVLLLNTSHFGAGLDLHMTTDLVIYHKFRNNDMRKQVIGRAQRLGRTKPLNVLYLKYDDE